MKNNQTREKIMQKAVELFNAKGIEYIGMRDLAGELGLRIGNLTYYFPTKDELVNQISLRYSEATRTILVKEAGIRPSGFLSMLESAFHHQHAYRCIPLSLHLLGQNPLIASRYKSIQQERVSALHHNLKEMSKGGFIRAREAKQFEYLLATITLIARYWISEARVVQQHLGIDRQTHYYLEMIAELLLPHSTAKGRKDIQAWLSR